jgi:predicted nucleotidyltransferase
MNIPNEEAIEIIEWSVDRLKKLEKIEEVIREYNSGDLTRLFGSASRDVAFNKISDILRVRSTL